MNNCECGNSGTFICPALERSICQICCERDRNSRVECIDNCEQNILGLLTEESALKALEVGVLVKMHDLLRRLDSTYNLHFTEELMRINKDYEFAGADFAFLLHKKFFFETLIDNKSVFDFFSHHNFRGFSNDEIVILKAYKSSTPTIFEFKNKINKSYFEASDILSDDGGLHRIFDSQMAVSSIQPGAFILAWPLVFPAFTRLGRFAMQLPEFIIDELLSELNALTISYADFENPDVSKYLINHLSATAEMANDIKNEFIDELLDPFDDEGGYYKEFFLEQQDYWEVAELLDEMADFREYEVPDEEEAVKCYEWLPLGDSNEISARLTLYLEERKSFSQNAVSTLGYILLFEDKLIISSHSRLLLKMAESVIGKIFHKLTETK
jgi:hypothetical protein